MDIPKAETIPPIAASSPQHAQALRTGQRGLLLKAGQMPMCVQLLGSKSNYKLGITDYKCEEPAETAKS